MTMTEAERRAEAVTELQARIETIRRASDPESESDDFDGVYGLEVRKIVVLTLAGGGPSAWIEFDPERSQATFFTTAPDYVNSAGLTSVELSRDEVDAIEYYGEYAGIE